MPQLARPETAGRRRNPTATVRTCPRSAFLVGFLVNLLLDHSSEARCVGTH
jgi:hypothetical protein